MTGRERFRETMRYGAPDRVPYFEEGLRDEVLEQWHAQGLAPGTDLATLFHMDYRERIPADLEPRPAPARLPATLAELKSFRESLDPRDPSRLPSDWDARVRAWRNRDHVLELPIHRGFFLSMGVGNWRRFEEAIYLLRDAPAVSRGIMEACGEFSAILADRILQDVEVDAVSFSEPIGGNDRPLLSPAQYRDFVLSSYRPVLEVLKRHSVETVIFVTYANARLLLPCVLEAGFNCLWACEVNQEVMDYRDIRREFGRDLRLIGGIDLDVLLQDQDAIRREIEAKTVSLLADGGYIPLADGRVRANVPYENYVHYRHLLEKMTQR